MKAFQFGFCAFQWDYEQRQYQMRPFNFYVFPQSRFKDRLMLFSVSALSS